MGKNKNPSQHNVQPILGIGGIGAGINVTKPTINRRATNIVSSFDASAAANATQAAQGYASPRANNSFKNGPQN